MPGASGMPAKAKSLTSRAAVHRLGTREVLEAEGTKAQRTASGGAAGPDTQLLLPPTPPVPTVPPQDEVEPPPPVTAKGPHLHLYNAPDQPPQPQARPPPSSQAMQHARPPPSRPLHQPQQQQQHQQPQQRSKLPGPLPVTSRPPNMDPNIFAAAQQLAEAASAPAAAARMQGSAPSSQTPPGGALPTRGPSTGPRPSVSLGRGPALPIRQPPVQGKVADKAAPPAQPRSVLQVRPPHVGSWSAAASAGQCCGRHG